MLDTTATCDCLVVGGGPAGSTAAALIAEAGFSTLLVERCSATRMHVGESLMPETYWTLKRLGVLEQLSAGPFVRKIGVQFVGPDGFESKPFFFKRHADDESAETWHVQRAAFDRMLFDNAAAKGAECLERTRLVDLRLAAPPALHRARLRNGEGVESNVSARVVVDATGQQAFLAERLGLRRVDPDLKKAAVWGHFRGGLRRVGEGQVTSILHVRDKQAWFWYIPLAQDCVSVGLVGDHNRLFEGGGPAAVFAAAREDCPPLDLRLRGAVQSGELQIAKEFSYSTKRRSGDGWVLVGDAGGFIDPIYSTGVLLALKSGELAAASVVNGLKTGDLSGRRLGEWSAPFEAGVMRFRKLVEAFYAPHFSFADFVKKYPEHRRSLTDLLIGRAFTSRVDPVLTDLQRTIATAERRELRETE